MKKITFYNLIRTLIVNYSLLFGIKSFAQVQRDFIPRFNQDLRGDVTIIANNMLSRTATEDYNGTQDNHDFSDNVYVDIDNDATTFNSSSANFSNPEPDLSCLTIRQAYLYWAAADRAQDNGDDNQPNWNFNDIKVMLPSETVYTTMTADDVIYRGRDFLFSNDPYVCVKDITDQVIALTDPYGTYQVANVEARIGELFEHNTNANVGTSGGWQMVFIYESPELNIKNVSVFDGYAHVTRQPGQNDFEIDFNGFETPPIGPIEAKVVIGSLEGDRALLGDRLQIRDVANNFVDLNTLRRAPNNFFNSKITVNNEEFLDRNPASSNTLGFDASVSIIDNTGNSIITNSQTSATIRLTSNQETYGLFLLGLSVDVRQPDLYPINLDSDLAGNNPNAGDNINFDFNIFNTGNDDAINVVFTTDIPQQLDFITANVPNGVTFEYNNTTRVLTFRVEDGLVDVGDPALFVNFDVVVRDECYFLEESCILDFEIQLTATYNGVENPAQQTTLSISGLDTCELGVPLPVEINQPPPAVWINAPDELDRTIECENTTGLEEAQALFPEPDKCNFDITKTSGEFIPGEGCITTGTFRNTWVFTDACGRTIDEYVQIITLIDTIAPTLEAELEPEITLFCEAKPEIPELTFIDNCANEVTVIFNEEEIIIDNQNTDIIRTWVVSDQCGNENTFSQIIHLAQEDIIISTAIELCIIDDPIDLGEFVSTANNGIWESDNLDFLDGTVLNPETTPIGNYSFRYIIDNNGCEEITDIMITIIDDCFTNQQCIRSPLDVDISKLVTPNGDSRNQTFDVFYVVNPEIDDSRCDINVKVQMFNRWGTRVFASDDYNNKWAGTAGSSIGNAEQLPTGTYYYIVELENSGLKPIQGYILLGVDQ